MSRNIVKSHKINGRIMELNLYLPIFNVYNFYNK